MCNTFILFYFSSLREVALLFFGPVVVVALLHAIRLLFNDIEIYGKKIMREKRTIDKRPFRISVLYKNKRVDYKPIVLVYEK